MMLTVDRLRQQIAEQPYNGLHLRAVQTLMTENPDQTLVALLMGANLAELRFHPAPLFSGLEVQSRHLGRQIRELPTPLREVALFAFKQQQFSLLFSSRSLQE